MKYEIKKDGDQWVAIDADTFENLQVSDAGYGKTPEEALQDLRRLQADAANGIPAITFANHQRIKAKLEKYLLTAELVPVERLRALERQLAELRPPLNLDALVNDFLNWPLPVSVCVSDLCTQRAGEPGEHRVGTNLLTAEEARTMFQYVLSKQKGAT